MIIIETTKLFFKKNDIYILENYNNDFIINSNYQGLLLLDNSLQIKKELIIPLKTPIYYLYKQYNNNNIMLYLPDINQIIFVDIKTSNNFTVELPETFNKEVLSPNYYWNDNILIFITFDNNFYQFNFSSKTLHQISYDKGKKTCPSFFTFFDTSTHYDIVKFYPEKRSFIFRKNDNIIGFLNCQQNTQNLIKKLNQGWHDVEYNNNVFIFIHENKIELISNNDKALITPYTNFIFLRAKFIDNNHFVVLSSNPSNPQENFLEIYTIS
jgi:hypothetical protein